MDDNDLIRRAKIAWHNNETQYIALPIYSTSGVQLLDISFYKEGHEWVGRLSHKDMVEVVKIAEQLREKEIKSPWQFLTEEEEADLFARYGEDCKAYIQARESVLRRKNT
jgi:hypothetical protein